MLSFRRAWSSSVGRKLVFALSGLLLIGFIFSHLAANILLYLPKGDLYNNYVHSLASWGPILTMMEIGLGALFVFHIFLGIAMTIGNRQARSIDYEMNRSKRGPSKSNLASRNMIVSGVLIAVFLVLHIWQFRFGPGKDEGYVAIVGETPVRDLYRLVYETFQNPVWVLIYVAVMILLGLHLRHGFWSAFQSLGAATPKYSRVIYGLGWMVAFFVAAGFLFIPIWIYFGGIAS